MSERRAKLRRKLEGRLNYRLARAPLEELVVIHDQLRRLHEAKRMDQLREIAREVFD